MDRVPMLKVIFYHRKPVFLEWCFPVIVFAHIWANKDYFKWWTQRSETSQEQDRHADIRSQRSDKRALDGEWLNPHGLRSHIQPVDSFWTPRGSSNQSYFLWERMLRHPNSWDRLSKLLGRISWSNENEGMRWICDHNLIKCFSSFSSLLSCHSYGTDFSVHCQPSTTGTLPS